MSNFNPNKNLLIFFKNWLSLENLSFWEKGREYLYGNNKTNCKDKNISNCNKNNKCSVYKTKKCVSKNTIHQFIEGETIKNKIFGKNYLIKSIYIPEEIKNKIILHEMINKEYSKINTILRKSISANKIRNCDMPTIIFFINYNRDLLIEKLNISLKNNNNNNNIIIIKELQTLTKSGNNKIIIKDYLRIVFQDDIINHNNYYLSKNNSENLFFYVFNEIESRNVYIIFPSGEILYQLYNSDFYLDHYFNFAVEYINKLNTVDTNNIILGGHSMGCVYAEYIGNILLKKNKLLFESKIWIVGTSPFKWINPEDIELYNQYFFNRILILTLVKNNIIDDYLIEGDDRLLQPNTYILYYSEHYIKNNFIQEINKSESNIYSYDEIMKKLENNVLIKPDNIQSKIIHSFENYIKVIILFLQLSSIQQQSHSINKSPIQQQSHSINKSPIQQQSHSINKSPIQQQSHLINKSSIQQQSPLINKSSIQQQSPLINKSRFSCSIL
jgi:hypothetical protein